MTDDTHVGAIARPVVFPDGLPTEEMQMEVAMGDRIEHGDDRPKRTHHPWLHPTKGWRMFSRPRGTNKRRKLVKQGLLCVFGSTSHKPRRAS